MDRALKIIGIIMMIAVLVSFAANAGWNFCNPKVCKVIFNADRGHAGNFDVRYPRSASTDDCGLNAHNAGATAVLLGCRDVFSITETRWAQAHFAVGPQGRADRVLSAGGPSHGPQPNCGWE